MESGATGIEDLTLSSEHVLLILLNELRKIDKMQFNNTGARMLDNITCINIA